MPSETEFAQAVRRRGGRAFIVGGWVRDFVRRASPKDKDFVVTGLGEGDFKEIFPLAVKVGRAFPVYLLEIDGEKCEVAFARRERKTGPGYRGFAVTSDPDISIEEDLFRRDTCINAMALELPEKKLIDPYGGAEDIKRRIIRAVSHHFPEDPVRALRAARQGAELNFTLTAETIGYMKTLSAELKTESAERVFREMERALAAEQPSLFWRYLDEAELLPVIFPEIGQLKGKTQPITFHPEGDAFEHSLKILDEVAKATPNVMARFAALCHDLGKGLTPQEMLPHHYGHEIRGLEALKTWQRRMTLPKDWLKAADLVISTHMKAPRLKKPGKKVDLLLSLAASPLTFDDYCAIIRADYGEKLPPYLADCERYIVAIKKITGDNHPPQLKGPAIAIWLREKQARELACLHECKENT